MIRLLALSFLFFAVASFADIVGERPNERPEYGVTDRDSCVPRNGRMAIFDVTEARAFEDANGSHSICRTQATVYRIEHFRASTIDAPEVYER